MKFDEKRVHHIAIQFEYNRFRSTFFGLRMSKGLRLDGGRNSMKANLSHQSRRATES